MRVLYSMVVAAAVLLSVHPALAQEGEEPKAEPRPWWLPAADAPKDQDPAKAEPQRDAAEAGEAATKDRQRKPMLDVIRERIDRREPADPSGDPETQQRDLRRPDSLRGVSRPEQRERLVYRLGNLPAHDVAQKVNELLKSESASQGPGAPPVTVVLAEVITNSVLISGMPDKIHEVAKLIEQLDRTSKMVSVEVILAAVKLADGKTILQGEGAASQVTASREEVGELIARLMKTEEVEILARPRIMTLDNQPAFIQIGERVPRVVTRGTKEAPVFETTMDNVGLIVGLTPRIAPDDVVTMEIDVEKSQLAAEDRGVPVGIDRNGNVVRSPRVEVLTAQTSVRVPPNRAVLLGGLVTREGDRKVELLVIVVPDVVEIPE